MRNGRRRIVKSCRWNWEKGDEKRWGQSKRMGFCFIIHGGIDAPDWNSITALHIGLHMGKSGPVKVCVIHFTAFTTSELHSLLKSI